MKKHLKILSVVICIVMMTGIFTACGPVSTDKSFEYAGTALTAGQVGIAYSPQSVATAVGEGDPAISYALKANSVLPDGLSLSEIGVISGTPTTAANTPFTFTIIASADGFKDEEAEFNVMIEKGTLVYADTRLAAGVVSEAYSQSVATATAAGNPVVTYALKAGSVLPSWLTLTNGTLSGTPTVKTTQDIVFSVVASAEHYITKEAEFALAVINSGEIDYRGSALNAGINTEYSHSIATASTGNANTTITYKLKSGNALPAGLELSDAGVISGTPTEETAVPIAFTVIASAAGFESAEAVFTIKVAFPLTEYIFEAEHVNMTGKRGAGLSYTAFEEQIFGTHKEASGYFYLLAVYAIDLSFDFIIESDRAAKGSLAISLGSEIGDITLNNRIFGIAINGVPLTYGPITVRGQEGQGARDFKEFIIIEGFDIQSGKNKITLTIFQNEIRVGTTGGPAIDYIKITASADLAWETREKSKEYFVEEWFDKRDLTWDDLFDQLGI